MFHAKVDIRRNCRQWWRRKVQASSRRLIEFFVGEFLFRLGVLVLILLLVFLSLCSISLCGHTFLRSKTCDHLIPTGYNKIVWKSSILQPINTERRTFLTGF